MPADSEIVPGPGQEVEADTPDQVQGSPLESIGVKPEFSKGHTYESQLQTREQKHVSKWETEGRRANASQGHQALLFQSTD